MRAIKKSKGKSEEPPAAGSKVIKITVTKRGLNTNEDLMEHARSSMVDTAQHWRDFVMTGHFETGAAQKYGYETRTPRYQNYKRKIGSPPALVYSGKAKRIITTDKRYPAARKAITKAVVTLRVKVPNSFWRRYKRKNMGQWVKTMADELTVILPKEVKALARLAQAAFVRHVNGNRRLEQQVYQG